MDRKFAGGHYLETVAASVLDANELDGDSLP